MDELLRYAAAAVFAFVAFGKVLSPQFMTWLVPLVVLVAGRRGLLASLLMGMALWYTLIEFPGRYWVFIFNMHPWLTSVVLARDVVLVMILLVLVWPEKSTAPAPVAVPA
jgi:hypothetical protein